MVQGRITNTSEVCCPYFRWYSELRIGCEGPTDDTTVVMEFDTKEARRRQLTAYCNDLHMCKRCEFYRMMRTEVHE